MVSQKFRISDGLSKTWKYSWIVADISDCNDCRCLANWSQSKTVFKFFINALISSLSDTIRTIKLH